MSAPRYQPMRRRPPPRAPALLWWAIIGLATFSFLLVGRSVMVAEAPSLGAQASPPSATPGASQVADQIAAAILPRLDAEAASTMQATPTPAETPTPVPPLPTPIEVPRPSPFGPTALVPDPDLAQRITSLIQGHTGRHGVAIKDLKTGRGVLIDPDADYPAASLFKLPVMYEVFKQRELGALSFDEVLYFTERHVSFDLGTLDRPAGSPIELREALERMVTISDNSSAILLTDRVGSFNINQDMAGLGFSHTHLDAVNLTTSPQDMLNFFEMIARGQAINPRMSFEMLELMGRQQVNDRIPRLLPRGASTAHKTGNLPGIVNDVGIVSTSDVSFAIAVMVNGTGEEGIAALTIAQIAADALDYFETVQSPVATAAPEATSTPIPTATVEPSPTPVPTLVPRPTVGQTATATGSPNPTGTRGTATPPTATARVTPSPTRSVF